MSSRGDDQTPEIAPTSSTLNQHLNQGSVNSSLTNIRNITKTQLNYCNELFQTKPQYRSDEPILLRYGPVYLLYQVVQLSVVAT